VVDKSENKTKNDYFLEMLAELLAWGLKPAMVTGDSWYSCAKNLKAIKNHGLGFMFAIKSNRTVSIEKGNGQQVQTLEIPENGLIVWLKEYGNVKLFRTQLKDQLRHTVVYLPDAEKLTEFNRSVVTLNTLNIGKSNNIIVPSSKFAISKTSKCGGNRQPRIIRLAAK